MQFISTQTFSGGYEDIFTGVCCIQDNSIRTEGLFVTKYNFSISNNGITYGNNISVYVFDSTCQDAKITYLEDPSFHIKVTLDVSLIHCLFLCQENFASEGVLSHKPKSHSIAYFFANTCQILGDLELMLFGII
jgi:hypothetical protein